MPTYARNIRTIYHGRTSRRPKASIIVISNRAHQNTHQCLSICHRQRDCEVIFVANGIGSDIGPHHQCVDKHVQTAADYGAYRPRNIGAAIATGEYLIFVDDDGIPHKNMITELLNAHVKFDIVSCMGCCKPLTASGWNYDAHHYYMGPQPFPYWTNLEGCCCIRSEIFYSVGGWDDDLRFGGGGYELSVQMLNIEPDKRKYIYYPAAVLGHDYCGGSDHLIRKRRSQVASAAARFEKNPNYYAPRDAWVWMAGKPELIIKR
jgi:GT2 family glycosyltransferase